MLPTLLDDIVGALFLLNVGIVNVADILTGYAGIGSRAQHAHLLCIGGALAYH
jgi:hypothetical protein